MNQSTEPRVGIARRIWRLIYKAYEITRRLANYVVYESFYRLCVQPHARPVFENLVWSAPQPPINTLFNPFGRLLYGVWSMVLLPLRWCQPGNPIQVESFGQIDYARFHKEGTPHTMWPAPAFFDDPARDRSVDASLKARLERSYALAYDLEPVNRRHSVLWETFTAQFVAAFFDENRNLKVSELENFRRARHSDAAIIADQIACVNEKSYLSSYFQSLLTVLYYHRMGQAIDRTILRSISEPFVGNSLCPIYRGQRLSRRLIRHAYYASQVRRHTDLAVDQDFTFLDLGGAYGGLSRMLMTLYPNAKGVVVELPEICVLTAYYLTHALPHKRVATLADVEDALKAGQDLPWDQYDVFVLPTWAMANLADRSIDLVINTTSLGEMSREYGMFYMENIHRICRRYFYSNNRAESASKKVYDDFGFYRWPLGKEWLTLHYGYSPTKSVEWLGFLTRR